MKTLRFYLKNRRLLPLASMLSFSFLINNYKKIRHNFLYLDSKPITEINIPIHPNLPTYTRKEVSEHYNHETRIWTTFRNGVYDITEFIKRHPGGSDKIILSAGGSLENFWEMYSFHKQPEVFKLLEKFRIGNLHSKDVLDLKDIQNFDQLKQESSVGRSSGLQIHQEFPFCAEGKGDLFVSSYFTNNENFFVRNHYKVPQELDKKTYQLELELTKPHERNRPVNEDNEEEEDEEAFKISLEELLQKYPSTKRISMIVCTGNRRDQMKVNDENLLTKGLKWKGGAIGNGIWEGVSLRDILIDYGYRSKKDCKGLHLIVYGYDKDFQGTPYNISIPLEDAYERAMLATKLNGEDIPHDHGYPVRLIVPGFYGVRNVKWVKSLIVSDEQAKGAFQQQDYKLIPREMDWEKVDMSKLDPINRIHLNSAIITPRNNQVIDKDTKELVIKGWSNGYDGAEVLWVELSFDQGKSWVNADLKYQKDREGKVYGWTLWEYKLDGKELHGDSLNIWVRAFDALGNEQPIDCERIWNLRGLANNSYHRVNLTLV